ncbi:hypothetical protein SCAR479_05273 [Seiridium cardinale]|uniref:Uncharacterized protein n=1 Tax=Seiridium cardinale TaxID=138064 RepID=A0ABR2XW11_9PEZI
MPYPTHYKGKQKVEFVRDISHSGTAEDGKGSMADVSEGQASPSPEDDSSLVSEQTAIYNPPKRPRALTPEMKDSLTRYDLVSTHRNLTRMGQYLLKLEARAETASKLHVRKTLDAAVENAHYSSKEDTEVGHHQLITDIERLSRDVWGRLHQLDRDFRKTSRENRDADGQSMPFQLHGESYVKKWIQHEINHNAQRADETCWYTVKDMNNNRGLREWFEYLADTYARGEQSIMDESRLVQLAWHYLDRSIRPPKPEAPISIADFINVWHDMRQSGAFEGARADPGHQRCEDAEALRALQAIWSSKAAL